MKVMHGKLSLAAILLASAIAIVYVGVRQLAVPMEGDVLHFALIAESIASGRGYVDSGTWFPSTPTMGRSPGWPLMAATGVALFKGSAPQTVVRVQAWIVHFITVLLLYLLARRLGAREGVSAAIALAWGFNPSSLYYASRAWSETAFVMVCAAGCVAAVGGNRKWWAALLFGIAVLIRPNFLMFGAGVALVAVATIVFKRTIPARSVLARYATWALLFVTPVLLWVVRNYAVSGRFPVISTLQGETLYGANNAVVAQNVDYWGYWVFPDEIPDETPKQVLAQTRNELELDGYYHRKAVDFIRANLPHLPRLAVGRIVRGFVPVPWNPSWEGYAVALWRIAVYALVLLLWTRWRRALDPPYQSILAAMLFATLFTTVAYYGCARFTFTLEPFLLPCVAAGLGASPKASHR